MSTQDKIALEHEFDAFMARTGTVVPPDWKAGVVAGFADLKGLTTLLRQQRPAASEPSNIFSLVPYVRET